MGKGEQKTNRETKKPKADKNKSKGGTPPHLMQQSGQNAPIVNQKKK